MWFEKKIKSVNVVQTQWIVSFIVGQQFTMIAVFVIYDCGSLQLYSLGGLLKTPHLNEFLHIILQLLVLFAGGAGLLLSKSSGLFFREASSFFPDSPEAE